MWAVQCAVCRSGTLVFFFEKTRNLIELTPRRPIEIAFDDRNTASVYKTTGLAKCSKYAKAPSPPASPISDRK